MSVLAVYRCDNQTRDEFIRKNLFGATTDYHMQIGDICILYDYSNNKVYGWWLAETESNRTIDPWAFGGRFPFQVKVYPAGSEGILDFDASKFFSVFGLEQVYDSDNKVKGERFLVTEEQVSQMNITFETRLLPHTTKTQAQPATPNQGAKSKTLVNQIIERILNIIGIIVSIAITFYLFNFLEAYEFLQHLHIFFQEHPNNTLMHFGIALFAGIMSLIPFYLKHWKGIVQFALFELLVGVVFGLGSKT